MVHQKRSAGDPAVAALEKLLRFRSQVTPEVEAPESRLQETLKTDGTPMRRTTYLTLAVALLTLPACLWAQAGPASEPNIDLRTGTLNASAISEWTLDEITEAFGRPTGVASGDGITGAMVHYHARGLSFWFNAKEKDPPQHLWIVTIYLSRSWDGKNAAWYETFKGTLTPAVDANWKQSAVLKEFASLNPILETVENQRKLWKASGQAKLGLHPPQTNVVHFTVNKLTVAFEIEPNTEFVERIVIHPTH